MKNEELVEAVSRYYPGLIPVFELAWRSVVDDAITSGIPNKVERAGIMHKNLRSELRPFCDELDPVVQLVERTDGLDYLLIDLGDKRSVIARVGRWPENNSIRRNPTHQQRAIQVQQLLDFVEVDRVEMVATIGYTVEDDYTEAGVPRWWMGRIVLLREHPDETEYVQDIAVYKKEKPRVEGRILAAKNRELRKKQRLDIQRIAEEIRRAG